jgi:cytochrome P450
MFASQSTLSLIRPSDKIIMSLWGRVTGNPSLKLSLVSMNLMTDRLYALLASAILLLGVYLLVDKSWKKRQFRQFAHTHSCRPPPHSASKLPWGLDRMYRMVKLTGQHADILETVIMPSFRTHGWTHSFSGLMGENNLLTADPDNIRAIFATQFQDFIVGSYRAGSFGYLVGKCIFTTDGPFWEHSRTLFRPYFMTGKINDLEATEKACRDMFQAISVCEKRHWTREVNLQALFLRFTLDNATEFLFGANVKSQLAAIPGISLSSSMDEVTRMAADKAGDDMGFTEAFDIAMIQVTKRAKLQRLYWLADSMNSRRAVKYLQNFCDYLVDVTLHQSERGPGEATVIEQGQNEKRTLLKALAQDTQDPIELRDQALFMLTAARDTTASLLSWMFLMLAKHPSVVQKLRAAVLDDFGTEASPKNEISFTTLKKCHYLQWVLNETLRLYPPAPINTRVAARDTTLPTGGGPDGKSPIAVRKGQIITLCVYAMQRRLDLWGDDAMEFKPERWAETRKKDWTFLPFSGGPRTCIGRECRPLPLIFFFIMITTNEALI